MNTSSPLLEIAYICSMQLFETFVMEIEEKISKLRPGQYVVVSYDGNAKFSCYTASPRNNDMTSLLKQRNNELDYESTTLLISSLKEFLTERNFEFTGFRVSPEAFEAVFKCPVFKRY